MVRNNNCFLERPLHCLNMVQHSPLAINLGGLHCLQCRRGSREGADQPSPAQPVAVVQQGLGAHKKIMSSWKPQMGMSVPEELLLLGTYAIPHCSL